MRSVSFDLRALRQMQHEELVRFFRDYYLSWASKDPNAAIRYVECLRALGAGSPDETVTALERHFRNDRTGPYGEMAEKLLAQCGPDPTFADMHRFIEDEQAQCDKLTRTTCTTEANPTTETNEQKAEDSRARR